MSFGKIFESMFTGSMVGSGPVVFSTWAYVIAHVKPPGEVEINPILLAAILGCQTSDVEAAIEKLCAPDPRSRTPDHEGRRLLPLGAYLYSVPSFQKYRAIRNEEARKEQNRQASAKRRLTKADNADSQQNQPMQKTDTCKKTCPPKGLRTSDPEGFAEWYVGYPWKSKRADAVRAWRALNPDKALQAKMIAATNKQNSERASATGFYPPPCLPGGWIRNARWNDDPPPASPSLFPEKPPAERTIEKWAPR